MLSGGGSIKTFALFPLHCNENDFREKTTAWLLFSISVGTTPSCVALKELVHISCASMGYWTGIVDVRCRIGESAQYATKTQCQLQPKLIATSNRSIINHRVCITPESMVVCAVSILKLSLVDMVIPTMH